MTAALALGPWHQDVWTHDNLRVRVMGRCVVFACPQCGAFEGWACNGPRYGYHAAGYHLARRWAFLLLWHLVLRSQP